MCHSDGNIFCGSTMRLLWVAAMLLAENANTICSELSRAAILSHSRTQVADKLMKNDSDVRQSSSVNVKMRLKRRKMSINVGSKVIDFSLKVFLEVKCSYFLFFI